MLCAGRGNFRRRRCLHGHRRICRVPSVGAQLDLANFCKKRPVHRPVRGGHVCGCRSQRLQIDEGGHAYPGRIVHHCLHSDAGTQHLLRLDLFSPAVHPAGLSAGKPAAGCNLLTGNAVHHAAAVHHFLQMRAKKDEGELLEETPAAGLWLLRTDLHPRSAADPPRCAERERKLSADGGSLQCGVPDLWRFAGAQGAAKAKRCRASDSHCGSGLRNDSGDLCGGRPALGGFPARKRTGTVSGGGFWTGGRRKNSRVQRNCRRDFREW